MSALTDTDLGRIDDWNRGQDADCQITLVSTGHEQDAGLETFCRSLADTASRVSLKTEREEALGIPEIRVSSSMVFSMLPLGRELPPFLDALSLAMGREAAISGDVRKTLESLDVPVGLKLYIALECPHCPRVLQSLLPLAAVGDRIRLHVIDGTVFSDNAAQDSIMSVPTLILDDGTRWTGSVSLDEVIDAMIGREPGDLSAASFKRILEDGGAAWIAGKILEKKVLFAGFTELLVHGLWSVRLGALVVLEEVAEIMPRQAAGLVPFLMEKLDGADITVKGDILYALGLVGDGTIRDAIQALADTFDNEDLKEAAVDAVDAIDSRS